MSASVSAGRHLTDYLSPILVKEARQGVRGNAFTGSLLLLQGLIALSMMLALLTAGGGSPDTATALFWGSVVVPALGILPASGLRALSSEREAGTLEPILMTHLSAERIVAGKWAALAAQILLLFTSVLPFTLLRYFLGSVDLNAELWLLLQFLLASSLVSALAIALSASRLSSLFRLLVAAVVAFPVYTFSPAMLAWSGRLPTGLTSFWVGVLALWGLTLLMLLGLGAKALAPESESNAGWVRLLGLAGASVALWPTSYPSDVRVVLLLWGASLALVSVAAALVEDRHRQAILDARFFAHGGLRAAAGAVFAPGWPSGAVFATLMAATGIGWAMAEGAETLPAAWWAFAVLASALQPVALTQAFAPRTGRRGTFYVGFVIVALAACLASGLAQIVPGGDGIGRFVGTLCPVGYAAMYDPLAQTVEPDGLADTLFLAVAVISIAGALLPAARALIERRRLLRPALEAPAQGAPGGAVQA